MQRNCVFILSLMLTAGCLSAFAQNSLPPDSLVKILPASHGTKRASILYELVYGYLRTDINKAKQYAVEVRREAKAATNDSAQAYLQMTLGNYASRTGYLDSALYYLGKAKAFAQTSNNRSALVRIYLGLGHAYISSGKPEKGLENMFEGLRVLEENDDLEMEMKLRTNIAWAYLELKEYRNCIRYGLDNIRKMEGTPYEWIALYSYNNVAISYGTLGILDSARFFIDKGIQASLKSNDMQALANGHFILGTLYANAGQNQLAIQEYLKARPYREKVGNPLFIVSDLYTLAGLYHKTGEYKKGIDAAQQALSMATQYNLLLKFEGTYEALAKNYEGARDFKNAAKYYALWATAKDSVYKNANTTAIAEMQTRYETEKKEQQLALQKATLAEQDAKLSVTYIILASLLTILALVVVIYLLMRSRMKRKRELFLREAQIQAALQSQESERRRFARDLHDGMGQLISALRLTLHSIDEHTPLEQRVVTVHKAEQLLNDIHQEIRTIAFNLMPQTLVQHGLIPAVREMSSRIHDSGKITIHVTSVDMPDRLTDLQEISLYRIVQEWINNIVKYAEASVIDVQFIRHENEVTIMVEDNGRGFDVAGLQRSNGNGWKNIKSRVNLIKATLELDSRPGRNGTSLIVKLPITLKKIEEELAEASNTQ